VRNVNSLRIRSIVTCAPKAIEENSKFDDKNSQNVTASVGVKQRRVSSGELTSDLCSFAAKKLFELEKIEPSSIDALIFVTQTPDYQIPSTSPIIAGRLQLKNDLSTFDINQGCSGFVSGLDLGASLLKSDYKRVLLLVGDTPSRILSPEDAASRLLFGDGASAVVIENTEDASDQITFHSWVDGKGSADIMIKNYGTSGRSYFLEGQRDNYITLNGPNVFSFAISKVPKTLLPFLDAVKIDKAKCLFAFHQANRMINSHLEKKLGLTKDQALNSIELFGNTSSASIPISLTMAKPLSKDFDHLCLIGFGVGLSINICMISKPQTISLSHFDYENV
jgi:3-oxoacyl-[acyl-carrier-protein] synthase III